MKIFAMCVFWSIVLTLLYLGVAQASPTWTLVFRFSDTGVSAPVMSFEGSEEGLRLCRMAAGIVVEGDLNFVEAMWCEDEEGHRIKLPPPAEKPKIRLVADEKPLD